MCNMIDFIEMATVQNNDTQLKSLQISNWFFPKVATFLVTGTMPIKNLNQKIVRQSIIFIENRRDIGKIVKICFPKI